MSRRKSQVGKTRPLDRRPCDTCGELIFFAFSPVSESWRALTAEPVTDDRRAFAARAPLLGPETHHVVVQCQAEARRSCSLRTDLGSHTASISGGSHG